MTLSWNVEVYEPNCDPGGYTGVFTVEAETPSEASIKGMSLAEER